MAEEQIKQKAKEKYCDGCNRKIEQCAWAWRNVNGKTEPNEENCGCSEVPAYIAGATENGIQWHDLRKNRLDLPRRNCTVLIFTDWNGYELKQFSTQTRLFGGLTFRDVIAWCEVPKLEV